MARTSRAPTASSTRTSAREAGLRELFRQFSFPGGIPSHAAPETPGSIHEGGELGYALMHAFGAAFDNPDLLVACVIGDGEAETGPLATSWHSNKFLNPRTDGAVLPILHLNGWKIANPTVLARIPEDELVSFLEAAAGVRLSCQGTSRKRCTGRWPARSTRRSTTSMASRGSRSNGASGRPRWPMIVLRTPKGWTRPKEVDGQTVEGTWRSQVPVKDARGIRPPSKPSRTGFGATGPRSSSARMDASHPASGARTRGRAPHERKPARERGRAPHLISCCLISAITPWTWRSPALARTEATKVLGALLRDVIAANPKTFRLFGPDETDSNRLGEVFKVTAAPGTPRSSRSTRRSHPTGGSWRCSRAPLPGLAGGLPPDGRHGLFNCYEAFIHIVDSMLNQREVAEGDARDPMAAADRLAQYLLSSHVWRQDHSTGSRTRTRASSTTS